MTARSSDIDAQAFLLQHIAELKLRLKRSQTSVSYQRKRAEAWKRRALARSRVFAPAAPQTRRLP